MPANRSPLPERLLLFDGLCNLCDRTVQFIIRHDPKAKFKFAPLQSDFAAQMLAKFQGEDTAGLDEEEHNVVDPKSIILILRGKLYKRSTAVIKIAAELGFPWSLAKVFYILPRGLRDGLYRYVARNRYRWYGKKESCMVPTAELRERFMGD